MTVYDYDRRRTGVLLVDPLHDFLADEGKLWPRIAEVAREVDPRAHLSDLVSTAREVDVPVFYCRITAGPRGCTSPCPIRTRHTAPWTSISSSLRARSAGTGIRPCGPSPRYAMELGSTCRRWPKPLRPSHANSCGPPMS